MEAPRRGGPRGAGAQGAELSGARFRTGREGDGRPGPYGAGVKDTIHLRPVEAAEVIARLDGYPGRCLLHCPNAEHQDMAMTATFEVV